MPASTSWSTSFSIGVWAARRRRILLAGLGDPRLGSRRGAAQPWPPSPARRQLGTSVTDGNGRSLPEGVVTFLFTDIEGSTHLIQHHGDAWPDLLTTHYDLLDEPLVAHGGIQVGTRGDAVFVAFESAANALAGAVEAQAAVSELRVARPAGARAHGAAHRRGRRPQRRLRRPRRARSGAYLRRGSRRSGARARRLRCTSPAARPRAPRSTDLGPPPPQGPALAHAPVAARPRTACASQFPGVRADAVPGNLPKPITSFIGRIDERSRRGRTHPPRRHPGDADRDGRFGQDPAGLQVASDRRRRVPARRVARRTRRRQRPDAGRCRRGRGVGAARRARPRVGIHARQPRSQIGSCCWYWTTANTSSARSRTLVADLLTHCPQLVVLATSQEALGIPGESVLAVGSMSDGECLQLFAERAAERRPGFALTDGQPSARSGRSVAASTAFRSRSNSPRDARRRCQRRRDRGAPRRPVPPVDRRQPRRDGASTNAAGHGRLELQPARGLGEGRVRAPRRVLGRLEPRRGDGGRRASAN